LSGTRFAMHLFYYSDIPQVIFWASISLPQEWFGSRGWEHDGQQQPL